MNETNDSTKTSPSGRGLALAGFATTLVVGGPILLFLALLIAAGIASIALASDGGEKEGILAMMVVLFGGALSFFVAWLNVFVASCLLIFNGIAYWQTKSKLSIAGIILCVLGLGASIGYIAFLASMVEALGEPVSNSASN